MNLHFTLWIFIYGSFVQCLYVMSLESVTPSDSSILNLVVESSTSASSDKLLKTTIVNSSDSFSSNNVNTESLHSNLDSEECKSGDCSKIVQTSSSSDNSSSASKILWNLVSTAKSTTHSSVSDEMDSEEVTVPLYFPVNAYSSNNSLVNNISFYSNDNELDSEISNDENLIDGLHTQTDKDINNIHSVDNYSNFTPTSTESMIMTTEILLNEFESSKENNSISLVTSNLHSRTMLSFHNISETANITEYTTTPKVEEITTFADDELDFTTYFLDMSNSTLNIAGLLDKDMTTATYLSQNSTTQLPYYDSEALSEDDNSSSLISVNYDTSAESDELKSKTTEAVNIDNSESHTSQDDISTVPVYENSENNTLIHPDYETSFEIEELKSKISRMIDIVDMKNDTSTSPVISDISTTVWTGGKESVTSFTSPNDIVSVTTEIPINYTKMKSSSEKYEISAENAQLNEGSTIENTGSEHLFVPSIKISWDEMANNDSLENIDSTETIRLTQEDGRTKNFTPTPHNFSMLTTSREKSTFSTNAYTESMETVDLNSNYSDITGMDDVISTMQSSSDDFIEKEYSYSSSVPDFQISNQNVSLSDRTESDDTMTTSRKYNNSSYDDVYINGTDLNEVQSTSTTVLNANNMNEINSNTFSTDRSYDSVSIDSSSVETSSMLPSLMDTITTAIFPKEDTLSEVRNVTNQISDTSKESISEINEMTTSSIEISTLLRSSDTESDVLRHISRISTIPTENNAESSFTPTEHFSTFSNITEFIPEKHAHETDSLAVSSSATKLVLSSEGHTTESTYLETVKPIITEKTPYETAYHTTEKIFSTTTRKTTTDVLLESPSTTDSKYFNNIPVSSTQATESSSSITTITAGDELSSTVTETHREGKHIPFSSTLVRRTTAHPIIFNVTASTHSYPSETDTTEHDLVNLRYNQIKADELSAEERTNLINAVVKFSDKHYTKDELIERMAKIHLWLLHAVADEYKNVILNLSATNNTKSDEIEFENLPQILYVLPSPEVFLPNISFTFVVHNKWRNETFPADIILTILNLHAENLKKILVDIEEIHFSQGLLIQKHDLMSVIIEKYGIILLSTCLITVGMIFLLICVVIYYRKKTRHSAHCLTDDKLHRNMQEAMGIDLNPAVIILQEEIREKAALNGNKVSSLDGDEGWLAPINDVPMEDNNAPFVQDTKL